VSLFEIQVTSNGEAYGRAEINVQSDTTIVTDYFYDSYCGLDLDRGGLRLAAIRAVARKT
jgi:hypothetical protein